MKNLQSKLYIIFYVILALCLYYGIVIEEPIYFLKIISLFWIWFTIIISAFVYTEAGQKILSGGRSVPWIIDCCIDLGIVWFLFTYGFMFIGVLYVISMFITNHAYSISQKGVHLQKS